MIKAGEVHSFRCIGEGPLVQPDVHLSPRFIQRTAASAARPPSYTEVHPVPRCPAQGGDIYGISKALRHSQLKETYLESFDERAVDDLIDQIWGP